MKATQPAMDLKRLQEITEQIRVGMLTTVEGDESLHSRPMVTRQFDADGVLWFFTYESSHKVDEVTRHCNVNISYAEPRDSLYVSITGHAETVTDRKKLAELWDDSLTTWFPQGLKEPDIALLRVTIDHAEFWDGWDALGPKRIDRT